jgi:hypothetical protein
MSDSTSANYVPGVRRRQMTPLYDTLQLPITTATAATIIMFGSVAGTVGINLTNMQKAFELPGVEQFTVAALRVVLLTMAVADQISMMTNYVCRLYRGRAIELEAPIEYFAGGAGIHNGTAGTHVNNGVPDVRAIASLGDNPIVIEGGDHFEVRLEGTSFAPTALFKIRFYLDGWFDKGVQ